MSETTIHDVKSAHPVIAHCAVYDDKTGTLLATGWECDGKRDGDWCYWSKPWEEISRVEIYDMGTLIDTINYNDKSDNDNQ